MIYSNPSGKELSSVEFTLLEILSEGGEFSGYEIDRLIDRHGYRNWAGIGSTSIYVGLGKLEKKGLAVYRVPAEKRGKGALPKLYSLTDEGYAVLRAEVLRALAEPGRRDGRFELALAAFPCVGAKKALDALRERRRRLAADSAQMTASRTEQGGERLPFHVRELFRYSAVRIDAELGYVDSLIAVLEKEQAGS